MDHPVSLSEITKISNRFNPIQEKRRDHNRYSPDIGHQPHISKKERDVKDVTRAFSF